MQFCLAPGTCLSQRGSSYIFATADHRLAASQRGDFIAVSKRSVERSAETCEPLAPVMEMGRRFSNCRATCDFSFDHGFFQSADTCQLARTRNAEDRCLHFGVDRDGAALDAATQKAR
jgi:hypothetical protein